MKQEKPECVKCGNATKTTPWAVTVERSSAWDDDNTWSLCSKQCKDSFVEEINKSDWQVKEVSRI